MSGMMCAYGNCAEWIESGKGRKITVTETHDGKVTDRQSFCCREHALGWLEKRINP